MTSQREKERASFIIIISLHRHLSVRNRLMCSSFVVVCCLLLVVVVAAAVVAAVVDRQQTSFRRWPVTKVS